VERDHRTNTRSGGDATGAVILIDERALTRQCLARWLELAGDGFRIVAVPRAEQVEPLLRHTGSVDLILLSVGAETARSPEVIAILERLGAILPGIPVTLVSDREDVEAIVEALRRGVRGYIPTSLDSHIVLEALRFIQAGGTFVPASALIKGGISAAREPSQPEDTPSQPEDAPSPRTRFDTLGFTPRELEVLEQLQEGKPNKIIAHELRMQESTVKVHVRRIMRKLNATNRTQAAFLARRLAEAWRGATEVPEAPLEPAAANGSRP